ncbi:MAG: hypothetical protein RJA70_5003, partial [Pseudomonadota bacterium]
MKRTLNRRLFLRGAGSVLIGLPLLEEFAGNTLQAQNAATPDRVLTLSFGLGIEKPLQAEGFAGPLEPLKNVAPKAAFFSNLENNSMQNGATVHFNNAATMFTGVAQNGHNGAGGPSMEQIVKNHLFPGGVPTISKVPSKSAGIWSRTGAITQYVRHWNDNGSAGETPVRRPSQVFKSLFGGVNIPAPGGGGGMPAPVDPNAAIQNKVERSVLDTVMAEYDTLKGAGSFLGVASKARIDAHLSAIREVEMQLVKSDAVEGMLMGGAGCVPPDMAAYMDPADVSFYDAPSGAIGGPTVPWEAAQAAFRLSGDLFVLAMACDSLRFGSLIFVEAGGHIRFQGMYNAIGGSLDFTSEFAGKSPHDAIFHMYQAEKVRIYQHYVMSQMGYVLDKMDAITEPNG